LPPLRPFPRHSGKTCEKRADGVVPARWVTDRLVEEFGSDAGRHGFGRVAHRVAMPIVFMVLSFLR
jgi:hypothetical protein